MAYQLDFTFHDSVVTSFVHEKKIWFIASTVAQALGYEDARHAVKQHCKRTTRFSRKVLQDMGIECSSPRGLNAIPEGDVYRLILRSKLESAQEFETLVCEEILPTLHKQGTYTIKNHTPELESVVMKMADKIENMSAVVNAHMRLCDANGSLSLTEAANVCKLQRKELIALLRSWKWIYRRGENSEWMPYRDKQVQGLVMARTYVIEHDDQPAFCVPQVRIMPRGLSQISSYANKKQD